MGGDFGSGASRHSGRGSGGGHSLPCSQDGRNRSWDRHRGYQRVSGKISGGKICPAQCLRTSRRGTDGVANDPARWDAIRAWPRCHPSDARRKIGPDHHIRTLHSGAVGRSLTSKRIERPNKARWQHPGDRGRFGVGWEQARLLSGVARAEDLEGAGVFGGGVAAGAPFSRRGDSERLRLPGEAAGDWGQVPAASSGGEAPAGGEGGCWVETAWVTPWPS